MGVNEKRRESSWAQFYQMIHLQFPHARVFDLRIRGGILLGFSRVEYVKIISREQAKEDRAIPEEWDVDWLWLWQYAQKNRDLDLPEILFRDGKPQMIPLQERGRNFAPEEAVPWNPPNLVEMDRQTVIVA